MNSMKIYLYTAPGWGHMSSWGPIFPESLIFSPTAHFLQDFHFRGGSRNSEEGVQMYKRGVRLPNVKQNLLNFSMKMK